MIKRLLAGSLPGEGVINFTLLIFRVLISFALFRTHGLKKLMDIEGNVQHIPDPMGLGSEITTYLAILVNVGFAGLIAIGFLTRISAIGVAMLTMTGFFFVHFQDPWPVKDVPLMYSISFLLLFVMGPGKHSLDHIIGNRLDTK